ncbi:GNAT family N-acetyltransferase [Rhodovastum atsumiense]|uniref:GNAT family N-acetyltransferase n=1 Tax=Rhodovastum atsumiense TaxID=504468 RepID=A0A5M6J0N1_9PROT|nr:GNAT family N-acetyltransferase [Rhodovastum atsumiense]KAA5613205.1 GNAT family N-acetyltransferase [Rhodovastum atsumiense]CAH2600642.1 GNAT family N-acetyltransferase [Rhodovastum atsumiense]
MSSTDEWRLRALRTAEAEAVAALIRTAFARQSVATDPPSSALRETAAGVLGFEGGAVAEAADGTLAGAVLWATRAGGLYMGRLAVAPCWRGYGIARALVGAAEAEARQRRLPWLHLSTRLMLVDNRRLFASCGFIETELHAHPGYAQPTFVDMEKQLPGP